MDLATIGPWVAAVLTLMVLSYIIADNPLYKVAEHVFVGAAAGWTFVLVYRNVLLGTVFTGLWTNPGEHWSLIVPLLLGLLLLFRPFPKVAWLGNIPLALVIGAGAALSIVGYAAGLLAPQAVATILPVIPATAGWDAWRESLNNLTIVVGVICTLLYFHFTGKQLGSFGRPLQVAASVGKYAMMISFGALFATIAISRISLLVGRVSFLLDLVR